MKQRRTVAVANRDDVSQGERSSLLCSHVTRVVVVLRSDAPENCARALSSL